MDPTEARLRGTILRIVPDKGFGFLVGPGGTEYFFHRSAVVVDLSALHQGAVVTFTPIASAKGPRAELVDPVE